MARLHAINILSITVTSLYINFSILMYVARILFSRE